MPSQSGSQDPVVPESVASLQRDDVGRADIVIYSGDMPEDEATADEPDKETDEAQPAEDQPTTQPGAPADAPPTTQPATQSG